VEANRRASLGTDYLGIMNRMPRETQNYVPKLQAIKNILMNPEKYGITLPAVPNAPYFGTVIKAKDIDTKIAAKLADMSLDDFLALNPSFSRPVIPGAKQPLIVLPLEKIPVFQQNLLAHRGQLSSYQHYEVIEKQRLEAIAKKFKMSEADLKAANGIPPSHKLVSNGTLLVLKDTAVDANTLSKLAEVQLPASIGANKALTEDDLVMKRFTYKARKNETVALAAKRLGVSVADLKGWNSFSGDKLAIGQTLAVMRAVRAGDGRAMVAAKNGNGHAVGKRQVKRTVKRRA
jgi:membrane-bound lytic murein transglycosylase D